MTPDFSPFRVKLLAHCAGVFPVVGPWAHTSPDWTLGPPLPQTQPCLPQDPLPSSAYPYLLRQRGSLKITAVPPILRLLPTSVRRNVHRHPRNGQRLPHALDAIPRRRLDAGFTIAQTSQHFLNSGVSCADIQLTAGSVAWMFCFPLFVDWTQKQCSQRNG